VQERDDNLALAVVPLSTREDFALSTTRAYRKFNSTALVLPVRLGLATERHVQVVRRKPTLTDTCRRREHHCVVKLKDRKDLPGVSAARLARQSIPLPT
jgi:hypothetical protein